MPYDYSLDKSRSSYNPWFSIGARLDWCVIFGPLYLEWETLISFAFSKMWKSLLMKKTTGIQVSARLKYDFAVLTSSRLLSLTIIFLRLAHLKMEIVGAPMPFYST